MAVHGRRKTVHAIGGLRGAVGGAVCVLHGGEAAVWNPGWAMRAVLEELSSRNGLDVCHVVSANVESR